MSLRVGVSAPQACCTHGASPSVPLQDTIAIINEKRQSRVTDDRRDYAQEYSSNSPQMPLMSDAMRIVHNQLGRVYVAEASLLKSLEDCNNPLDLEYVMDGLSRLRVVEMEIQRLLLRHVSV